MRPCFFSTMTVEVRFHAACRTVSSSSSSVSTTYEPGGCTLLQPSRTKERRKVTVVCDVRVVMAAPNRYQRGEQRNPMREILCRPTIHDFNCLSAGTGRSTALEAALE